MDITGSYAVRRLPLLSGGTMSNLEVYHREFRSHSGADSEENLIALCAACHARLLIAMSA